MTLRIAGTTSGYTEIDAPAVAGNNTIVLPSTNGSANQLLKNGSTAGTLGWSSMVETTTGVGINTTGPSTALDIAGELTISAGSAGWRTAAIKSIDEGGNFKGTLAFYTHPSAGAAGAPTERARIDSSGTPIFTAGLQAPAFLIRRTYASSTTQGFFDYDPQSGTSTQGLLVIGCRGNDGSGGTTGVSLSRAATTWGSYSDERAKTDLVPIENGLSKVETLRAVTGRYKEDEEGVSRSFLIAQDVQAVLPEAVDASDPDKLNLRYAEVIPLLVAALKEGKERIETLEAANAALEARLTALEAQS